MSSSIFGFSKAKSCGVFEWRLVSMRLWISPLHQSHVLASSSQNFCLASDPVIGYGQPVQGDLYRRIC
ncbi:hypothetical protein N665_0803s0007 [Sinapis alba]|nr:hypothetical protein N665_0803s0007 [Sinapis alba]